MQSRMVLSVCIIATVFSAVCMHAEECVKFPNDLEKLELSAIITKPEGDGPFPAVVMLCGCGGWESKEDAEHQKAWVDRLVSWGYITLQVDSFGPRGYRNICDRTGAVSNMNRLHDAYSAKSYLARLAYIDPNNIAVMGWSHGGWAVMAIVDGFYREKDQKPFQAAIAFYPFCTSLVEFDTPLLILIGEKDDWCPAILCAELRAYSAVKDSKAEFKLSIYPNAYHAFDFEDLNKDYLGHHVECNPEAMADAIQQTKDFLAEYLETLN